MLKLHPLRRLFSREIIEMFELCMRPILRHQVERQELRRTPPSHDLASTGHTSSAGGEMFHYSYQNIYLQ